MAVELTDAEIATIEESINKTCGTTSEVKTVQIRSYNISEIQSQLDELLETYTSLTESDIQSIVVDGKGYFKFTIIESRSEEELDALIEQEKVAYLARKEARYETYVALSEEFGEE